MAEKPVTMLLLVSVALLLVLLLRKPARRLFGAGPAFLLWLLVPALASAAWLRWPFAKVLPQLANAMQASPLAALVVHPQDLAGGDRALAITHATPGSNWLLAMWLTGAVLAAGRLLYCHRQLRRQSRAPTPTETRELTAQLNDRDLRRIRIHPLGPAVLCGWRSAILLPPDFVRRFTAQQRRLVLSHECTHLRRGDPWWCLLAELTRALLWFHPLIWLALPRFRIDQELACDAATLRRQEHSRSNYARTLLGDLEGDQAALVAGWIHPSQLKERLVMLKSRPVHSLIRRSGYSLILAAIGSLSLSAVSALSVPGAVQAETVQTMPPVISVNLSEHGIYWNGELISGTSLQHRAVIASRVNPRIPILLTYSDKLPTSRVDAIAKSLSQSGLVAVEQRAIDTSPLPEENAAKGEYGRYMTYRSKRRPHYPPSAIANREQGTVVLKVHYDSDGSTLGARVEPTDTSATLVKAALAAALTWRSNANPGAWARIPIEFKLKPFPGKPMDKLPDPPPGMMWQLAPDGRTIHSVPLDKEPLVSK